MRRRMGGFSLLEIMLVLVLLGGVAALTIGTLPDNRSLQQTEARLATQLQWAGERAVEEGTVYGLAVASREWRWMKQVRITGDTASGGLWPGYRWQTADRELAKINRLPDEARLQLMQAGREQPLSAQPAEPQILLLPGGEVTPFTLWLLTDDQPPRRLATESTS